jgi:predicted RNase H-like nuclease (RuvC/YqgF family)
MLYSRALALAIVLVPLAAGTGCVTKQEYDRDIGLERAKTVQATRERDQAMGDLKKANGTIAALSTQVGNLEKVQEQLAGERRRVEALEASIKTEAERAKKTQERAVREAVEKLTAANHTIATQLAKAHKQIAELKKELEQLKKEERTTAPSRAAPAR